MMRAAIFDLDGTIADSAPDIAAALNAALADDGLAPFDLGDATSMVGAGARTLVQRALTARGVEFGTQRLDAVQARFIVHYDAHPCVHTQLYPGARETLQALADAGWQLGICTNKPQALADAVVRRLGIGALFQSVVGGQDGIPLKPAPDMVQRVMAELASVPDRAVMIGDSKADLGAGRAAGMAVILFTHGYNDAPVATLGADAVIDHFAELRGALDRVGTRAA